MHVHGLQLDPNWLVYLIGGPHCVRCRPMDLYPPPRRATITTAIAHTRRKVNSLKWIALVLVAFLGSIVFAVTKTDRYVSVLLWSIGLPDQRRGFPAARELYYTHKMPIDVWVPPPAPQYRPNRNAIITSVWTANETLPAAVLGHSISRWTPAIYEEGGIMAERCGTVDMLLLHFPEAVEEGSREALERVGWKLRQVEPVIGPKDTPEDWK